MKNKCLDDFYKRLSTNVNRNYAHDIKNLIESEKLTTEELSKVIEKEALNE